MSFYKAIVSWLNDDPVVDEPLDYYFKKVASERSAKQPGALNRRPRSVLLIARSLPVHNIGGMEAATINLAKSLTDAGLGSILNQPLDLGRSVMIP